MSVGSEDVPAEEAYRVDESTEVQKDRVEGDDAHGLKRVAVDDIACYDGVAHLDTGSDCRELSLAVRECRISRELT